MISKNVRAVSQGRLSSVIQFMQTFDLCVKTARFESIAKDLKREEGEGTVYR